MTRPSLHSIATNALVLLSFCVVACVPTYCQTKFLGRAKDGLSIGWFTYLSNKQEISPDYAPRPDASLTSKPTVGFVGKFEYNKLYGEHVELSLGGEFGAYPTDFVISLDSAFSTLNRDFHGEYSYNRQIAAGYAGIFGTVGYIRKLSAHHFIATRFGVNFIYFIPAQYGYGAVYGTNAGTFQIFDASANINPNSKIIVAHEVSFRYYYWAPKKYMPYISINGVYSNSYPVVGNRYSIFGKNETLTGTFRRRFLHAGVEVGVKINL
jgi:hypothetical protein